MRKSKLVRLAMWAILMLGQYAVTAYGQASCQLASGGQSLMPVIVSATANASVIESAEELADYLGRITGGDFSVEVGSGATGIVVGLTNDFAALQSDQTLHLAQSFSASTDVLYTIQSYVLQSSASRVAVIGGSELGVEYAVWDLLYKLGYRKFFPGDAWEVIPSLPNASVATDVFEKPDYADRRIWYGYGGDLVRQRDWNFRNRMNHHGNNDLSWRPSMPAYLKAILIDVTEGFGDIISINQAEFNAHPEYYGLVGGQRWSDKLCLANTNVQQLALNAALTMFNTNPDLHRFSVSMEPSDAGGWCECANCVAMGAPSTRLAVLANYVAKGLETTHPDKWVGIMSYNENADVPATNLHARVWVACATGLVLSTNTFTERFEGWKAKGAGRMGVYDYWGIAQWRSYLPAQGNNLAYVISSIPSNYKLGARIMVAEASESWGPKGLDYYIASRLLWSTNAASNAQALTDDFLVKAFGSGSEAMRSFYTLMDITQDGETGYGLTRSTFEFFTDRYKQMYAALLWASDAAGNDPAIQARLDDLFLYTRFVQLYCEYEASGYSQATLNALILFSYRIRETCLGHWAGVLGTIEGATAVDLTPPPSCVTPALKAEARAAAVLATANSPVHVAVAPGLVAHWMLNETSGTTATDATGNGNDGILFGGATWTNAGKVGGGLYFDGVNDYVDVGNKLNPGCSSWSVALWFKAETIGNSLYDKEGVYQASPGGGFLWYAWRPHWVADGGTAFSVTLGQWYHATIVYDKTNQYLYKDGALVYSRPQTGDMLSNTNKFMLGAMGNNSVPYGFFKGTLDEVRVYNKALTAAEVAAVAAITQPNRIPVAAGNAYTMAEDASLTVAAPGVLGNDSDADGDAITATKFINPANGKYGADHGLALNTNGAFTYAPRTNWNGTDTFTYRVTDSRGAAMQAVVTITVTPVDDLPVANAQSATAMQDTPNAITLTGIDVDGNPLTFEVVANPTHGGLSGTAPNLTYTPNANWTGTDTFTFRVNNGRTYSAVATVTITVQSAGRVNYPAAHWTFDETSGTTAGDSTGNGNTGTLVGGPVWTSAGKVGGALIFDGVNDYVDIGDKLDPGTNSWTVALWFKAAGNDGLLYNKEGLYETQIAGGYIQYAWQPYYNWFGYTPVTLGQWCHVTVVYDKTSQYVYKNGVAVYTAPQTGNMGANTAKLLLGARGDTTPFGFFNGTLDDVRIYDTALTAAEVAVLKAMIQTNTAPTCSITNPLNGATFSAPASITINAVAADNDGSITKVEFYNGAAKIGEDTSSPYSLITNNVAAGSYAFTAKATDNAGAATVSAVVNVTVNGSGGVTNGLVAHWMFDETSGTTAADSTGNGNGGTLVGGPTWTSAGKIGGGLSFDGVNDYVDIGNKLNPGSSNWTVALWFKETATEGILYNKEGLYEAQTTAGYFQYAWQPYYNWWLSVPVALGQWYHVTVVYDKVNQCVYKDGVLVITTPQAGDMGSNTAKLLLGARGDTTPFGFFTGTLDDVRMYNRALTAGEVATLAAMGQGNTAPTCSITNPLNGATFSAPASITINATAADSDGSITKVEFYGGAVKLGEDTSSPYSLVTNGVVAGSYALTVRATDNSGAMTTSAVVNITVNGAGGVTNGLAAYWMLDETSGTTAADATGNGNGGTLVGGATWTSAGKIGGGLIFDGVNDYVDIGDKLSPGSSNWTVALWFKAGNNEGILYNKELLYEAQITSGYFQYAWQPYYNWFGYTQVTLDQWYHYAVVYDKTNQYVYRNGELISTMPQTGNMGANTAKLLLGARGDTTPWGFFTGTLDDVRVYSRALTATEVAELATMGEQEGLMPPNVAPTDSISSPANGATFTAPASITINATASDSDGSVTKVEFYNGAAKMGEDSSSPYSLVTNNVVAGSYTLTVRATDDDGAVTTSAVVNVTVNPPANVPPTCSITNPLNGATFSAPASITINAIASDSDGSVAKVEFYNGAAKMGEDLSSPYSLVTNNVVAGSYALTVRATDNSGAITTSAVVNVTVVGLPSPWTAQNIGAVGLTGDTIYNSGTFTNKGAGTNIAGTVDAFRYVQQVTSGDCELKLRVASISNTSSRAKAGVMIRGSLTANAMEAGVWVTPSSGIVFTYRTSNGGSTTTSTSSGKVAPYWVRITRTSNSFKAYYSSNGTSWTQLGSTRTISMPTSAYMGMGTCSGNTNLLCISAMDNVTATP